MKTIYTIFIFLSILFTACTTGYYSSAGYDDLYYTPGDAPVVASNTATETVGQSVQTQQMSEYEKYHALKEVAMRYYDDYEPYSDDPGYDP
jgi:hypothetical protein